MFKNTPRDLFKGLNIDRDTGRLIYAWLLFAILSLVFAGIFAFMVAMARTPYIQNILPGKDYFYTALVTHVDLSVVIWFLSFMGVLWIITSVPILHTVIYSKVMAWVGFSASSLGTITIVITAFLGLGTPVLSNYVPLLKHPVFYIGLLLFASGIMLTIINVFLTVIHGAKIERYNKSFPFISYGMCLAGIAVLIAFICFGLSYSFLMTQPVKANFFERLFWGGGHILQFANTIGMIIAWTLLLYLVIKVSLPFSDRLAKIFLGLLLIFIIPAPLIYFIYDVTGQDYKDAFTLLMQIGIGPTTGLFVMAISLTVWRTQNGGTPISRIKGMPWTEPGFSSLLLSILLFAIGAVISLKIHGSNVKIPSHYHGVIGAVTIAFMGLTYYILPMLKKELYSKRIAMIQPYLYGVGQILFVIGMFWAGTHGVPRKTFGSAQVLRSYSEYAGMAIMGLGGLIAITGGGAYVINGLLSLLIRGEAKEALTGRPMPDIEDMGIGGK